MKIRKKENLRCTAKGRQIEDTGTGAPTEEKLGDGQLADHYVMCPEERAKGFVEPVRTAYQHVGIAGPRFPLVDLTDGERERFGDLYAKFERYPESESPQLGRYWSQAQLDKIGSGCGTVTTMPQSIAETYAREPAYYGRTFCCGCGDYFPVGRDGEFVWDGTRQRVGTRRSGE